MYMLNPILRDRPKRMAVLRVLVEVRAFRGLFVGLLITALIVAFSFHTRHELMAGQPIGGHSSMQLIRATANS